MIFQKFTDIFGEGCKAMVNG